MHRLLLVASLVLPGAFGCEHEVHHTTMAQQQPQPVPVAQRQRCNHQPGPMYGPGGRVPQSAQDYENCPPPPEPQAVPPAPSATGVTPPP